MGAEMAGAKVAGAEVAGVEVAGAEVAGAEMAGAEMAGAEMAGAEMAGAVCAGGRVVRWQVRCERAGVVYLSVWRSAGATAATLISKNRITIPDGEQNTDWVSLFPTTPIGFMTV
jgi:uncharacterized protein YjbI with pentapeptide repeats